jgi:hypothetical protein
MAPETTTSHHFARSAETRRRNQADPPGFDMRWKRQTFSTTPARAAAVASHAPARRIGRHDPCPAGQRQASAIAVVEARIKMKSEPTATRAIVSWWLDHPPTILVTFASVLAKARSLTVPDVRRGPSHHDPHITMATT